VPSCILQPLWNQLQALVPARSVRHPLGCHRPRVPDRVIFDKLIQVLVLSAATAASPTPPARRPRCAAAATSGSPWAWPSSSPAHPVLICAHSAVRCEDDLQAVLADVRLDVAGRGAVALRHGRARPEAAVRLLLADVDVWAAREVEQGPLIGHPGSVPCYVLGVTVSLIPAFFPRIGSTVDGRCTNATQVAGSGASSRRGSPVAL
jgi:hypothetical protein